MPILSNDFKTAMGMEEDKPTIPSEENMREMSFREMTSLRNAYKEDKEVQKKLAPFEHAAYARETVQQNAAYAIPLAFMIPGYQIAKELGLDSETATPPDRKQMQEAFHAIYETLRQKMDE